jgi:hypothetical protein
MKETIKLTLYKSNIQLTFRQLTFFRSSSSFFLLFILSFNRITLKLQTHLILMRFI